MYQVYKDDERFGKRPLLAVEMESRLVGDDQPMQRAADREMRRAAAESGLYEHTMALKDVDSRISSLTKTTMSENEIKSLVVPLTALKKKIEAAITLIEGGFLLGGSDDR